MVVTNGTEEPSGRLGAVLRLRGTPDPVGLTRHGPWVVTTLEHARAVLADPVRFDFPSDVSRRALRAPLADEASSRSPHAITPPLGPDAVARGRAVFSEELTTALGQLGAGGVAEAMQLLREPVARSTVAAVLPELVHTTRDDVADLVLAWIDALGPVIARGRPPARWTALRRRERRARRALELRLDGLSSSAAGTATVLAAGVQVPIAAGAFLLVALAELPALADTLRARPDLDSAVAWETIRLFPPTWITARVATTTVTVGNTEIPAGAVAMVSPLLLGRDESLVPGPSEGRAPLAEFDPFRWDEIDTRPGAWLPFGAGPHACPGRNLGLAQLRHLAGVARQWSLSVEEPVSIDQSRGIFPARSRLQFQPW